jgi:hypothetical protein
MEVKIKQGNEMLDATIEMVDGVMVVSPKKVKFEPKDGDIVTNGNAVIAIFKMGSLMSFNSYAAYYDGGIWINEYFSKDGISLATEEEKKRFFVKLAEEGYEFDFEKKELIKLKWKPSMYDPYYIPFYETCEFVPIRTNWNGTNKDDIRYNKGLCIKTKEECQEFCNRLNDAINSVKP